MRDLVTPRLLLRAYRDSDADFLLDMYQRPEVLRFLPKERLDDLAGAAQAVLAHAFDGGLSSYYDGTPLHLFQATRALRLRV